MERDKLLELLVSYCSNDLDGELTCMYRIITDRHSRDAFLQYIAKFNIDASILSEERLCMLAWEIVRMYKAEDWEWGKYMIEKLKIYINNCN